MNEDIVHDHKRKMLEYLEKESDFQRTRNDEIMNRAGISATLLTGISFVVLDNEIIKESTFSFCNHIISGALVLSVLFILAFFMLVFLLLYKHNFRTVNYDLELGKLYGTLEDMPEEESTKWCSLIMFEIYEENKKVLSKKAYLFNASIITETVAATMFIYLLNK